MAVIRYNKDSKTFSVITKRFSNYTRENIDEFEEFKRDFEDMNLKEYNGRFDRLLFKNQPQVYYILYPPKSGGGSPHVELVVHPDSTFNFMDNFDPIKYMNGLLKIQIIDKRRFKRLSVTHRDYDLLATFFTMTYKNKNVLKLGNIEVLVDDRNIDFYKIIDTLNNFDDRFYLNDIKRIFPYDYIQSYYTSKVGSEPDFTVKFMKTSIRLYMILNRKVIMSMILNKNGSIDLSIDEDDLQRVIGTEKDYTDLFEKIFTSGRCGFTKLNIEYLTGGKKSPIRSIYNDYRIDGESDSYNIR